MRFAFWRDPKRDELQIEVQPDNNAFYRAVLADVRLVRAWLEGKGGEALAREALPRLLHAMRQDPDLIPGILAGLRWL